MSRPGVLEYRGYDVSQLVENYAAEGRYGFEECTYLLFSASCPPARSSATFALCLTPTAACPQIHRRYTDEGALPFADEQDSHRVLALYAYDENPDDTSLGNMLRQASR